VIRSGGRRPSKPRANEQLPEFGIIDFGVVDIRLMRLATCPTLFRSARNA